MFTFKDYGYSCLALGSMSAVMTFIYATNPYVFPYDFSMMGTSLSEFKVSFSDNKALTYLSRLKVKNRGIIIAVSIISIMFMLAWQAIIGNMSLDGKTDPIKNQDPGIIAFGWIIGVLWFLIIFMAVLNEVIYNYKKERNLED